MTFCGRSYAVTLRRFAREIDAKDRRRNRRVPVNSGGHRCEPNNCEPPDGGGDRVESRVDGGCGYGGDGGGEGGDSGGCSSRGSGGRVLQYLRLRILTVLYLVSSAISRNLLHRKLS